MKQIAIILLAIIICIAGCVLFVACKSHPKPPPAPVSVPVKTEIARLEPAVYFDEYPGNIIALNQVAITPEVSGYITAVHFKDGQYVTKGQLLYSLDQQQYQANVLQANADYKVALSNLQMAQQDADRYLFLQKNDAIAKQVVDHSLSALQAAKMQAEAAKAAIQNVRTGLKYTTIYAPLSGTIGISMVKPGAAVSPGITVLNTISSDDPIGVDFNVDEKQIGYFEALQKSGTLPSDSTIMIKLPDGKLYPFNGNVSLLDRAVDPQTATIKTRLQFVNPADELKSGMSCVIRIKNMPGQKALLIPYKAVTEQLGEYYVFTVNDNKAKRQKIQSGRTVGENIIVTSGISDGDVIVTEGTGKLKDGTLVSATSEN